MRFYELPSCSLVCPDHRTVQRSVRKLQQSAAYLPCGAVEPCDQLIIRHESVECLHDEAFMSYVPMLRSLSQDLKRCDYADPFLFPVAWHTLGLPDYPEIVRKPMDLETMEKKMRLAGYALLKEFVRDFHRIVANCLLYNGERHEISRAALRMQDDFIDQLSRVGMGYCDFCSRTFFKVEVSDEDAKVHTVVAMDHSNSPSRLTDSVQNPQEDSDLDSTGDHAYANLKRSPASDNGSSRMMENGKDQHPRETKSRTAQSSGCAIGKVMDDLTRGTLQTTGKRHTNFHLQEFSNNEDEAMVTPTGSEVPSIEEKCSFGSADEVVLDDEYTSASNKPEYHELLKPLNDVLLAYETHREQLECKLMVSQVEASNLKALLDTAREENAEQNAQIRSLHSQLKRIESEVQQQVSSKAMVERELSTLNQGFHTETSRLTEELRQSTEGMKKMLEENATLKVEREQLASSFNTWGVRLRK